MIVLSFIIPCYNAENTVINTLHSIYSAGLNPDCFEVLLIDDCSDRPLQDLLKHRQINYPNLRVIRHHYNKKQGGGRNTGIRAAKGNYIAFVDADDLISNSYCEIVPYLSESVVDIIACRYYKQDQKLIQGEFGHRVISENEASIVSGKEYCEYFVDVATSLIPPSYVYSKSFLLSRYSPFQEHVYMEDADWVADHLFHANQVLILNSCIYYYLYNASSTVHSYTYLHAASWVKTGIRKLRLSQSISDDSLLFSDVMERDGKHNIEGVFSRLYKIDNYRLFFCSISEDLRFLREKCWSKTTMFYINHPRLSVFLLCLIGPPVKISRTIIRKLFR